MKNLIALFICLGFMACANNNQAGEKTDDMSGPVKYAAPDSNRNAATKPLGRDSAMMAGNPEVVSKRQLLYTGIDSTYSAIRQIEDVKNEIGETSSAQLSAAERNLKAKALMKLNVIQNNLVQQVDSVMLINLKHHARQLRDINASISVDVSHLKDVAMRLDKISAIMQRLTDVLTVCISRGIIKPPTPPTQTPNDVKAATAL